MRIIPAYFKTQQSGAKFKKMVTKSMEIMHCDVGAGCDKKFGSWLSKQACLWENVIHNSERD
mgnify:CR=1 FL=1